MTQARQENVLLSAALARAAEGWAVHPLWGIIVPLRYCPRCECSKGASCDTPGKHPRLTGWQEKATTNPTLIWEMWRQYPRANPGGAAGKKSGRNILDVDPRHGGEASLELLIKQHGELPETQETVTGSGGRHMHFAHNGVTLTNTAGVLGPGLDIRSDGGNVVLPGSIHVSGRVYEYEATHGPEDVPLAPMPTRLVALLQPHGNGHRQPLSAPPPGPLSEGTVHYTFVSWAGTMHKRGLSPGAILAALLHENSTRCNPIRPEANIRKIVDYVTTHYMPGAVPAAQVILIEQQRAAAAERVQQRREDVDAHAKQALARLWQGGER